MHPDMLQDLIANLAQESGISDQEAGAIFTEAFAQQRYGGGVRYFQNAHEAENWMNFDACENAKRVMSQVEPELYYEWTQWKAVS